MYRNAWKICSSCFCSYFAKEYSLMCTACRKTSCEKLGISLGASRNYDKKIWEEPEQRKDFEWTLVGLQDEQGGGFIVDRVFDCWSDELKDFLRSYE